MLNSQSYSLQVSGVKIVLLSYSLPSYFRRCHHLTASVSNMPPWEVTSSSGYIAVCCGGCKVTSGFLIRVCKSHCPVPFAHFGAYHLVDHQGMPLRTSLVQTQQGEARHGLDLERTKTDFSQQLAVNCLPS